VKQRERESLPPSYQGYQSYQSHSGNQPDSDPHSLLFGFDDEHGEHTAEFEPVRLTRADRRRDEHIHHKRHRRRGRLFVLLTLVIVAVVAAFVVPWVINYFKVPDYSGTGTGSVTITVPTGATASDIGGVLTKRDVVKSSEAFTDAASDNPKSESIQPGTYTLHQHMSGKAALAALLDPASRSSANDLLVTEGATSLDVRTNLLKVYGQSAAGTIDKALGSAGQLGIPVSYKVGTKLPSSGEGFYYPATYTVEPNSTPADTLQKMVSRFIEQDRKMHFATAAQDAGITPYQALIIASIAQAEAKYATDMPKVTEVIYNRLRAHKPLQIDATTKYACDLSGETHCVYNNYPSPYNTYVHADLPPTPIGNPGAEAMEAAVHPEKGALLFYVNGDKQGHLTFTDNERDFEKARHRCAENNWGCG
jgi:UPF0755 protein